jgi:hypothetical protein
MFVAMRRVLMPAAGSEAQRMPHSSSRKSATFSETSDARCVIFLKSADIPAMKPRGVSVRRWSVAAVLEPRSIAVVGANRARGKIGSEILHNLIAAGFTGRMAAVHPSASEIDGIRAYPRVGDIPWERSGAARNGA